MIKINHFLKPTPCKLYHKDTGFIGWLYNEYQFNHIRIQIKQQELHNDYYIVFKEHRINFLPDGDMDNWVEGFFEKPPKTYEELANALTNGLTWTGYEECHLDTQVVEVLVGNFIKYITNKK